jgi:hypothetical protein
MKRKKNGKREAGEYKEREGSRKEKEFEIKERTS